MAGQNSKLIANLKKCIGLTLLEIKFQSYMKCFHSQNLKLGKQKQDNEE